MSDDVLCEGLGLVPKGTAERIMVSGEDYDYFRWCGNEHEIAEGRRMLKDFVDKAPEHCWWRAKPQEFSEYQFDTMSKIYKLTARWVRRDEDE